MWPWTWTPTSCCDRYTITASQSVLARYFQAVIPKEYVTLPANDWMRRRNSPQGVPNGCGQGSRSVAPELFIHPFEPSDQVEHLLPGNDTSRGTAEVGAASKGASLVDHAPARAGVEQGTRAIRAIRHFFASGCPQRMSGHECLAPGEHRGETREFEMTAICPQPARPFHRTPCERLINRAHFIAGRFDWSFFSGHVSAG